jgi:hypothetical protein
VEIRKCKVCGARIPAGRIEAIPEVDTCVDHSEAVPIDVELDIVDTKDLLDSMQSTTRGDRS